MIGTQRRPAAATVHRRARAALLFVVLGPTLTAIGCARSDGAVPDSHRSGHDAALRGAMADSTQWPSYGRDYTNQRYSPLVQVNAGNAAGLQLAWHFKTGLAESF